MVIFISFACKLNSSQSDKEFVNVSNIDKTKVFKGYIKQRPLTKLYFNNDGNICFMPYKKGDHILKGQVIARLDSATNNNNISDNLIISPFDGYIEEIYKTQGTYIKEKQPVLAMYSKNKTQAEVLIDAKYINKINLKKEAQIEAFNNTYEAKISNILRNDNDYIIELELNKLYKELKCGLNIEAKLNLNK